MNERTWVEVTEERNLKEGGALIVSAKGLPVLLLRREGTIFAISNRCPHMGCPLAGGTIDEFLITCPCHDWTYDIRTGEFLTAPEIVLPTFHTKAENGKILVQMER